MTKYPGYTAAMDQFEEHRAAYLAEARARIKAFASDGRVVTVQDAIDLGPPVPKGCDPRVRGAIFSERGVWVREGYRGSRRRDSHGRMIMAFRLAGVEAPA